jgi:hypothetical protein
MSDSNGVGRKTLVLCGVALTTIALAAGLVVGVFVGTSSQQQVELPFEIPVNAAAAYGQDGYAFAAGPVDDDLEGVFFLDALTGELRAAVLNPRTGRFMIEYYKKIANDFGQVKNGKYMIVTGSAKIVQGAGGGKSRYALSVVYVIELTSGRLNSYAFKVPANLRNANATTAVKGEFIQAGSIELRKSRAAAAG